MQPTTLSNEGRNEDAQHYKVHYIDLSVAEKACLSVLVASHVPRRVRARSNLDLLHIPGFVATALGIIIENCGPCTRAHHFFVHSL